MDHDHDDPQFDPLEDPHDPLEDHALNAFLEESLGGPAPPDLSAQILNTWRSQGQEVAKSNGRATHPPLAPSIAEPPVQSPQVRSTEPTPPPVQPVRPLHPVRPVASPVRVRARVTQHTHRSRWTNLGVAAALLLFIAVLGAALLAPQIAGNWFDTPIAVIESPNPRPDVTHPVLPTPSRSLPAHPPKTRVAVIPRREFTAPQTQPFTTQAPLLFEPQVRPAASPRDDMLETVNVSLQAVWDKAAVAPSPQVSPEEWLDRIYLRLIGRQPTAAEKTAFANNESPHKQAALVDHLLDTPAFADHWAHVLVDPLMAGASSSAKATLHGYIKSALLKEQGLDEITAALLTATGSTAPDSSDFNPAASFLAANYDLQGVGATTRTASMFLGKQLQCVQCHHHPVNEWRQSDFWEIASFFRQLHVERSGEHALLIDVDFFDDDSDSNEAAVFYETPQGELVAAYPKFADIEAPRTGVVARFNRRQALATLVTQSDDFSRAIVNRVWAEVIGYGFANPIDDMGPHNPPHHAELLTQLSEQFRAHNYDLKELVRWVALTETLQLANQPGRDNLADAPEYGDTPLFSRYYVRSNKQSPQAMLEVATGTLKRGDLAKPAGGATINASTSIELTPATLVGVGRHHRYLIDSLADTDLPETLLVDHLFWAALSRSPNPAERRSAMATLQESTSRREALQVIWWALLASDTK